MPALIITRGLPASGKSTRARAWVAESPATRARINRDDLRAQLHDSAYHGQDTERQITAARDAAISALLRRGVDVVCDETALPQRAVRDIARLGRLAGAEVVVWDMTDVPVDVCVERDAARPKPVGEGVIRDMHARFIAGKKYPLPMPDDQESADSVTAPYVAPAGAPKAVMVDVDGTVALMGTRSAYDETRVHEDRPNLSVIAAVRAMHAAGHAVIFCSGRTEGCREATEKWLTEHVAVPVAGLHMRAVGDMRKDSIVKAELFDAHIRYAYDVTAVFDDRQQVVDGWRALGLTVFQVAPGNF
ncbi:MAG TPA: AAA family ATPase [Rugosimonospora sp.]|nr:AAA family ATPase [Rugosimonospora sp.]